MVLFTMTTTSFLKCHSCPDTRKQHACPCYFLFLFMNILPPAHFQSYSGIKGTKWAVFGGKRIHSTLYWKGSLPSFCRDSNPRSSMGCEANDLPLSYLTCWWMGIKIAYNMIGTQIMRHTRRLWMHFKQTLFGGWNWTKGTILGLNLEEECIAKSVEALNVNWQQKRDRNDRRWWVSPRANTSGKK